MPKDKEDQSNAEESSEESNLEEIAEEETLTEIAEEIKDQEPDNIIESDQFQEFMQTPVRSYSPVLEKIAEASEPIVLEQETVPEEENQGKPLDYTSSVNYETSAENQEFKYESNIEPPVLKPRETHQLQRAELIDPMAGRRINLQNDMEPQMAQIQEIERRILTPIDEDRKKYKEFKFR